MDDKRRSMMPALKWLGLAVVAGIVAGVGAVYVMGSWSGNATSTAAVNCAPALATAKRIGGLATGDVAAFRIATEPDSLADLAFKGPEGGDVTLADFSGKTLLVNFWATWCVPCRTEMPALDRLQAHSGSDRFQVVAVNIDLKNPDRARAFLDKIGVKDLTFYSDPTMRVFSSLKKRGLAIGLPTSVLVDTKGCRVGVVEGPAEWDSEDAKALIKAAMATG